MMCLKLNLLIVAILTSSSDLSFSSITELLSAFLTVFRRQQLDYDS